MEAQSAKCLRCGRVLRSAKAIADGRGRTCQRKVREALAAIAATELAIYTAAQVANAAEAIADGAIVPADEIRPGLYVIVSSAGTDRYLTGPTSCTCKASQYGKPCYHRAAALILATAFAA